MNKKKNTVANLGSVKSQLSKFKRLYKKAKKGNKESFTFNGRTFVTGFAKHLIEYYEQ